MAKKVKKITAIICSESTSDGNRWFLAKDGNAANLFARCSDIIYGAPEEVDLWGGWEFDVSIAELEEHIFGYLGELEEYPTAAQIIALMVADGTKVANATEMRRQLGKGSPNIDPYYSEKSPGEIWDKHLQAQLKTDSKSESALKGLEKRLKKEMATVTATRGEIRNIRNIANKKAKAKA